MVATYQMAGDAGTVAGPVTAGYLVDTISYGAAFGLAAGVLGVAAVARFFSPAKPGHRALPAVDAPGPTPGACLAGIRGPWPRVDGRSRDTCRAMTTSSEHADPSAQAAPAGMSLQSDEAKATVEEIKAENAALKEADRAAEAQGGGGC